MGTHLFGVKSYCYGLDRLFGLGAGGVVGLEELWGPNMRMLNIADNDFEASTGGH